MWVSKLSKYLVLLLTFFIFVSGCLSDVDQTQLVDFVEDESSHSNIPDSILVPDKLLAEAMMAAHKDDQPLDYIIAEYMPPFERDVTFEFADFVHRDPNELILNEENSVRSPDGSLKAVVAVRCQSNLCTDHLLVEKTGSSQLREITFSERMPSRPLAKIAWVDNHTLAFTQWNSPHFAYRYAVDVEKEIYLLTIIIADKCFRQGTCGN